MATPSGARELTLEQVAAGAGVAAATVRRGVGRGLIPGFAGSWTPAAAAYVRVIERLRARGHSLEEIKLASDRGQLAVGPIENLLVASEGLYTLRDVARETGLSTSVIERLRAAMGLQLHPSELMSEEDMQVMRYVA